MEFVNEKFYKEKYQGDFGVHNKTIVGFYLRLA